MKNGNGRITTKEVYELVEETRRETKDDIIRLEEKVDKKLDEDSKDIKRIDKSLASFKGRVYAITAILAIAVSLGAEIVIRMWLG